MTTALKRDQILTAAAQIFREKGYHAASMRDIAEAVELRKASLYYHVHSKQELLLEILDQALDLLIEDLSQVLARAGSPTDKLRMAMRSYIGRLASDADLSAVLLLEHRSLSPELRAGHIERRDRFEELWRSLIVEGIRAGDFRPVDPAIVGFVLLGVQNWTITWYRPDGPLTSQALADQFADVLLEGLRPRDLKGEH